MCTTLHLFVTFLMKRNEKREKKRSLKSDHLGRSTKRTDDSHSNMPLGKATKVHKQTTSTRKWKINPVVKNDHKEIKKKPKPTKKVRIKKDVAIDKARANGGWRKGKEDVHKMGLVSKFTIDCGCPSRDGIFHQEVLKSFLEETLLFKRPSVSAINTFGDKTRSYLYDDKGEANRSVKISIDRSHIVVECDVPFSKNYVTLQVKKFLKRIAVNSRVKCIPTTLSACELICNESVDPAPTSS